MQEQEDIISEPNSLDDYPPKELTPVDFENEDSGLASLVNDEEVSDMLAGILGAPENSKASGFSDEVRQAAADFNFGKSLVVILESINSLKAELPKLFNSSHAHIALEWNKAVVEEDQVKQELLKQCDSPQWLSESRLHFQLAIMCLERAVGTRSGEF